MSFVIEKVELTKEGYVMFASFKKGRKKESFIRHINFDDINYNLNLTEADFLKWTNKIEHTGISRRITTVILINIFQKIFKEIKKNGSVRRSKVAE